MFSRLVSFFKLGPFSYQDEEIEESLKRDDEVEQFLEKDDKVKESLEKDKACSSQPSPECIDVTVCVTKNVGTQKSAHRIVIAIPLKEKHIDEHPKKIKEMKEKKNKSEKKEELKRKKEEKKEEMELKKLEKVNKKREKKDKSKNVEESETRSLENNKNLQICECPPNALKLIENCRLQVCCCPSRICFKDSDKNEKKW